MYAYDVEKRQEKFIEQQWLAYFAGWNALPNNKMFGKRPKLVTLNDFKKRWRAQKQTRATKWDDVERAAQKAYERMKRRGS